MTTMIPASIRNKNPGAQEPGPSSRKFGSTSYETLRWTYKGKPATNKIATFPTSQHGAAAMFDLLSRKYTGKTIAKAIETWCGGYYAGAYTKALQAGAGVKDTDKLTKELVRSPAFAVALCKAMARVEAGREFPMSEAEWQEAHVMAFGAAVAPEFSPDNDVPSPGPNARLLAEAKEVAKIAIPAAGVVGGGTAAVTSTAPAPPPVAKPTAKEQLAKAQEVKTLVEQAKDLGTFGVSFGKWAVGDGLLVVGLIVAAAALVIGLPKLKERFS